MKIKKMLMGLALAGLTSLVPSMAAAESGPYYLAPKLMFSHTQMDSFGAEGYISGSNKSTGAFSGSDLSKNGFGGGLSIGYDFGTQGYSPLRVELEYLMRQKVSGSHQPTLTSMTGVSMTDPDTNVMVSGNNMESNVHTLMANVFLDFKNDSSITPYIGLGLGGAYVDSKLYSNYNGMVGHPTARYYLPGDPPGAPTGAVYAMDFNMHGQQSSWNFAWQAGAGVGIDLTDRAVLDISYRYSDFGKADFGTSGYKLFGNVDDGDSSTTDMVREQIGSMSTKGSIDLSAHEVLVGLRIYGY